MLDFKLVCHEPKRPARISGKVIKKTYVHQINTIHRIRWKASRDPSVVTYRLYYNDKCVAKVSAEDQFLVELPWRMRKKNIYYLTAMNAFGQESAPLTIQLPHPKKNKY